MIRHELTDAQWLRIERLVTGKKGDRGFRRWAKKGVWERIFNALVESPDFEYLIIDSTIVRAHQHAAGAKGGAKMRRSGVRAAA